MKKFISCMFIFAMSFSLYGVAEVAVIVNTENSNEIQADEIPRIFLGKVKTYGNGDAIEPINSGAGDATRSQFEEGVLNKSSSQVKAYWSKLVFSGKGKPLKEVPSDADVLNYVAANKGAIGYVDASNVNDSVKVISTK